ncbi:MAG: hypothetical protein ACFFCW_29120 [Candidatus Hodarchaeota archaeon]
MWVIGHTAFAYLIVKPMFVFIKKELDPNLMLFVFIFANIIDVLHFSFFRFYSHNLFGTVVFSVFWLLFFRKFEIIKKRDFIVLLFIVGTHIITDLVFSDYFILFPINKKPYSVYGLNSIEDLITESVFAMAFLLFFYHSRDFYKLKTFLSKEKKKFFNNLNFKAIFNPSIFTFYLFVAFYLFNAVQLSFFVITTLNELLKGSWYFWMFLISFIAFFYVLTILSFGGEKIQNHPNHDRTFLI